MKTFVLSIVCLCLSFAGYSNHLKGGWIYYESMGPGTSANTIKYRITVKQYLDCSSTPNQIDPEVYLGIFNNTNNQLVTTLDILRTSTDIIEKKSFDPCINNAPYVCYRIDSYVTTTELPITSSGYTLAVQRCCRIANIVNVVGSSQIGVSYTTSIPGTINGLNASNNNSPVFAQKDTAVVCYNGTFTFEFGAVDADGDSLSYAFCPGLIGGGSGNSAARPKPPSNPPYSSVPYSNGFNGLSPMGPSVTINSATGLISGTAPSTTGDYVVSVCASEFRNGVKIGETKKEIHVTVANCSLSAAQLKTSYITCDGFNLTFQNESTSSLVATYLWQFGDPRSGANNTSTAPSPTHLYSDTGVYTLKLRVESSGGCKDSTTSEVKIYPGFIADFDIVGSCFETPFNFVDKTRTQYGVVDTWRWDFGDQSSSTDVSTSQNPNYKYPSSGLRNASLIVTNSKGCMDTITKSVDVRDIPVLNLPFKDTLICSIDTLQLKAEGSGAFKWTANTSTPIINPNAANPLVSPKTTTVFNVTLNDNGCVNLGSVRVNVLNSITVDVGNDTSICKTDSFVLKTVSEGLGFRWTPSAGLNNPTAKNPKASPNVSTKYYITANLGKCLANDSIFVRVAPYPLANAGNDVTICYGDRTQLTGTIIGSSFTWTPASTLLNARTLTPTAGPLDTTRYVLTAYDTVGCPKPSRDTVLVQVIPRVKAFAGNDTNIVANQLLQLKATGGSLYTWTPATGLNNTTLFALLNF